MKLTSYFKKQELQYLPMDELLEARTTFGAGGVSDWLERYQIKQRDWVLPQLYAHILTWKKTPDCLDYVRINTKTSLDRGVYILATHAQRGELLVSQVKTPRYGALVPLLLAPHKESTNTPYSYWQNIHAAVDPKLQQVLQDLKAYTECNNLSDETIQEILLEGLVYKSGKNTGKPRSPTSTWRIALPKQTPDCIRALSPLSQVMLFQIWLAHPKNRLSTMVLNPLDWDNMPISRITDWQENISKVVEKPATISSLPWEW